MFRNTFKRSVTRFSKYILFPPSYHGFISDSYQFIFKFVVLYNTGFLWHFLMEVATFQSSTKCDANIQTEETLPAQMSASLGIHTSSVLGGGFVFH